MPSNIPFRWIALALSIAVGLGIPGHAQLKPNDPLRPDSNISIGKLSNGLVYFIRQNKTPSRHAELRLVIKAGSLQEDDNQQGLAHLLEHMAFNGTTNFKRNDIISYLQSIGVEYGNDLNAYTNFEETVYQLPIPLDKAGNLEKGIQILQEWAHNISNRDEAIKNERNIVLEESRSGQGADDRIFKVIYPKLYAGSRYSVRLPIGKDSIVKNAPAATLRQFYADWYRPNLMGVFVVGDVDTAKTASLIRKYFGGLQNPEGARTPVADSLRAYQRSEALVVTDKEATSYSTMLAWSAQPSLQPQTVAQYEEDILRNMYTTIINQRLGELTQQENPPYLSAGLDYSFAATGYRQLNLNVNHGSTPIAQSVAAAIGVVQQAKRFGFTQPEVDRLAKSYLSFYERSLNESSKTPSVSYAEEYIRHFLTDEPIPGIAMEYAIAKRILTNLNADSLSAFAKKLPYDDHVLLALTGPQPNSSSPLPTPEQLLTVANAAFDKNDGWAYAEAPIAEALMSNKPKGAKVMAETTDATMGTTTWTLANGISVVVKPTNFKNDQVLLEARRPGGLSNYGAADRMNARYAAAVVSSMGVSSFSPLSLQKVLSGKMVSAAAAIGGFTDGYSASSNAANVETMLQLLYLRATSPRVDTVLFRSFLQKSKAQLNFAMADPENVFVDTLIKTIYNNHPLAPITFPTNADFDSINIGRCLDIYKERVGHATGMQFAIVGSVNLASLKPLVETYLGALPTAAETSHYKDNGLRPITGSHTLRLRKGETDKALVLMMETVEVAYTEELDTRAQLVGEILNQKIDEVLREKLQGLYSGAAALNLNRLPYGNAQLFVQLPCNPQKTEVLIDAFNAEVRQLQQNGPLPGDLQKIKKQWAEQDKISLTQNDVWLDHLMASYFPGANRDRFLHFEQYLNAITPQQIKEAARLLLPGKNQVTAILQPASPQ